MSLSPMIAILGAGESGVGAAVLAHQKGINVFVSEKGSIQEKFKNVLNHYEINWEEGEHSGDIILGAVEIIKSPGIPDTAPIVNLAIQKGIPVISEIEFAARFTNAKLVCVTGSNGKTTTTLLIYHILKKAGLNVGLAGNVGKSFAWQVAENQFDIYVLEISSFQLDGMYEFKADIAVLLNITPDHLDRYNNNFEEYARSKFRIVQNQTGKDFLVYWADDKFIISGLKQIKSNPRLVGFSGTNSPREGAYQVNNNKIIVNINSEEFEMEIKDMLITGRHNVYNTMAASITARLLDIRKEIIKQSLVDFENIEHRLEHVAVVRGIEFINDSKATNINSAWYALESLNKPIIWIVGGLDKGNDYQQLADLAKSKVKAIVCLGKDNTRVIEAFNGIVDQIVDTHGAEDAVKAAYKLGNPGDVVLLSPACASFDLFENFEDRGWQFKKAVYDL